MNQIIITIEKRKIWKDLSVFMQLAYAKFGSNGCGGKGMIIKPPYSVFFNASCVIHDYNYTIGGSLKDKWKADLGLYKYMRMDIVNSNKRCSEKFYYFVWAFLYFLSVSVFGVIFFSFGKKRDIIMRIDKVEYKEFIENSFRLL